MIESATDGKCGAHCIVYVESGGKGCNRAVAIDDELRDRQGILESSEIQQQHIE